MKKYIFFIVCLLFGHVIAFSQTIYYELIREVVNGISSKKVSGGQFITFIDKRCYESDKWGYSVNNGVLKFHSIENGISKYLGDGYWGYCIFKFSLDKQFLNVETADGDIYVYKHSSVPVDVTTSSLIKSSGVTHMEIELEAATEKDIENYDNFTITTPVIMATPTTTNSSSVENRGSHEGFCYNCGGKGYIEKLMYFGSSQGNRVVRVDCGMCVRSKITR